MDFAFSDYIGLMERFLAARRAIVDDLERQLFGARGRVSAQHADRDSIADIFKTCFFESPAIARDLTRLSRQLDAAHLADGFEPARQDGYSRGLDPVELVLRAFHHWERDRWPGRNARLVFADSLYAVFMLRQLELLSLRIWDKDEEGGRVHFSVDTNVATEKCTRPLFTERLQQVQRLLDLLNGHPGGIRLARDARWLIQTAQGPLTRHVKPYIVNAGHVSRSFTGPDRVAVHTAGAVLAGGHLRSQLRHLSWRTGWTFDDPRLLALTRASNSMDMALLVRDLVPLLEAYEEACARQDGYARLVLADAILQGLSADPELLLTRLDLLEPSTLLEELFVARGDAGAARFTEMGETHRACLGRYGELVARTATSLRHDGRAFDPAHAAYSPLGVVYGFCADLFANVVLNTSRTVRRVRLQPDLDRPEPDSDLTLEDLFDGRNRLEEKRALAEAWEGLPKDERERAPFEHSTDWGARMYARLVVALEARATRPTTPNASTIPNARLYVVPRGVAIDTLPDGALPAGIVHAQEHCLTSDAARARLTGATALTADRLSADRAEGRYLASASVEGVWFAVSKVPLTLFTSHGTDVLMTEVPDGVVDVLRCVCPERLVVVGVRSVRL